MKHNSAARHEIQRKCYVRRPIRHAEYGAYLQESPKSADSRVHIKDSHNLNTIFFSPDTNFSEFIINNNL